MKPRFKIYNHLRVLVLADQNFKMEIVFVTKIGNWSQK